MKQGKYEWVLKVIESYEEGEILSDFLEKFEEGKDISEKDYFEFCLEYTDDVSEEHYIRKNWEFVISEGDESVFDEDEYDEDDEDEEEVDF